MNQRRLSGVVWPLFRRILDPYHQYEPTNPPKNDLKRPSEIHPPSMPYTLLALFASLRLCVEESPLRPSSGRFVFDNLLGQRVDDTVHLGHRGPLFDSPTKVL